MQDNYITNFLKSNDQQTIYLHTTTTKKTTKHERDI
ncbi:hypothetical protein O163_10260 [Caldanaerobacter subterraneus subsp. yonseiensis KB-1]|uniref:Uncharacterized protein n=1 Tax=Caldanaerobacter subterraneus subsp. yonseiensis KB-1 TaxID=1388761 RepID=U5CR80_CALSX|nr:hypothetical protein O163_10260 [Caldanaerobacter subterraneus subsp. yonseiensis KB-1]